MLPVERPASISVWAAVTSSSGIKDVSAVRNVVDTLKQAYRS